MLVLADREREPVRAVELDDLDLGRLSLAREDLLGAERRAERRRPGRDLGDLQLGARVRPRPVVRDVGQDVEHLLRRGIDVHRPLVGHDASIS
jgi:hypothetical protein